MSTFTKHQNYGEDPEYDAYIERLADPEWTGSERDPSGWMADRAQARWERDRGSADLLAVIGFNLALVGAVASLVEPDAALWLVIGCLAWLAVSVPVGVVVGRAIGGRR